MAKDCSFDIVSKIDMQEVDNAVNQTVKEMAVRYDFRGGKCSLTLDKVNGKIELLADDQMKLRAIQDILSTKFAKRNISVRALEYGKEEKASGDAIRQEVKLVQGIETDVARTLVKKIKETKVKVQPSIQGDELRVSGKNIDDLQAIIQFLKSEETLDIPLQFVNFRS